LKQTTALPGHTNGGSGTKECSHTRTPTTATTAATTATTATTPVLPTIPHVPGLSLVLDAFSIEEERLLVQEIHNHGEQGHGATSNATGKQLSNETTGWSTCARKEARESNTFSTHAHRRVMHFGHRFDYDTRGVGRPATGGTLPPFLQPVVARIQQYCGKNTKEEQDQEGEELFDQCTVNEYQSGHGISAHVGKSTRGRQCCSFLTRY
jgi:alkylated DNA repair dioxygenase AlkB